MKIVVATRNLGKLSEIRAGLQGLGIELLSLADFPAAPEVDEDGDRFAANAVKKARRWPLTPGFRPWPMIPGWKWTRCKERREFARPALPGKEPPTPRTTPSLFHFCMESLLSGGPPGSAA